MAKNDQTIIVTRDDIIMGILDGSLVWQRCEGPVTKRGDKQYKCRFLWPIERVRREGWEVGACYLCFPHQGWEVPDNAYLKALVIASREVLDEPHTEAEHMD